MKTNKSATKTICWYDAYNSRVGSSARGRSRISKVGNEKLRNLLFLCAFNTFKYNTACGQVYERILSKGKTKKLALIAVANKLLKQCFAFAKSSLSYDAEFASALVIK